MTNPAKDDDLVRAVAWEIAVQHIYGIGGDHHNRSNVAVVASQMHTVDAARAAIAAVRAYDAERGMVTVPAREAWRREGTMVSDAKLDGDSA